MKRTLALIALLALAALIAFLLKGNSTKAINDQLAQAYRYYQQGDYNAALTLYLQLENQYRFNNKSLNTNIGNTYFQLNQIPQAILYYNRASDLHNLSLANAQLNLPPPTPSLLPSKATLSKLFALFAIITLLTLTKWQKFSTLPAALSLITLCLLGYQHYFIPLNGILIKASDLYLDPKTPLSEKPLPAGLKVEVLGLAKKGKWFKVRTHDGSVRLIPQEKLRVV